MRLFTPKEDMQIWRFVMEKNQKHGEVAWTEFINRTGSTRSEKVLWARFGTFLLPHLPFTTFHTETKLKLCKNYKFRVDEEFLKTLKKDAIVAVDNDGTVRAYTMKPTVGPNTDMQLDDEEFMKSTSPITYKRVAFTKEEDVQIWNYFIKHRRRYTRGSYVFWDDLIREKKWNRTAGVTSHRFNKILAPQLHKTDFDMKTKLELYKSCKIPVDPEYLKTLKEQYELEVDKKGCIVKYEKIDDKKYRSSSEKKLEQRNSSIHVKTEDISEPVAKRQRYEKEFYIDSESDLDETDSESRFGDFEDVENQNSRDSDEDHQVLDGEPQRPTSQRREQKVIIPDVQLQELEDRIVEKLTTAVQNAMVTVSEDLIDAKITKMSKTFQESLRTEILKVSSQKILPSLCEHCEKSSRKKKEFLLNLKNLISPFHAPELEDVAQRIDRAVQNSPARRRRRSASV